MRNVRSDSTFTYPFFHWGRVAKYHLPWRFSWPYSADQEGLMWLESLTQSGCSSCWIRNPNLNIQSSPDLLVRDWWRRSQQTHSSPIKCKITEEEEALIEHGSMYSSPFSVLWNTLFLILEYILNLNNCF